MFIALTLVAIVLSSMIALDKLGLSKRTQHQLFIEYNGAAAFIAFGIVAAWLVLGVPRGQYPDFSLWPLAIVSVLFTLSALRANKVYRDRYGTTPASM